MSFKATLKKNLKKAGLLTSAEAVKNFFLKQPKIRDDNISKDYIRKFLPSNCVIIDAGAHKGMDAIQLHKKIRKSSIHAFEPVPELFSELKANSAIYSRISCYELALSNKTGEEFINISSGDSDASSSLLTPKNHLKDHPDTYFDRRIKVKTITLDDWAIRYNIDKVDFLWLDMQGHELDVLMASSKIFPTVQAIHMEVNMKETYEGVSLYPQVREWLSARNFKVQIEAIPENWDTGNVLFLKR